MSDFLENLKKDGRSFHSAFLIYITSRDGDYNFFVFVEGQDDVNHYAPEIKRYLGRQVLFIDCDGKNGVLQARNLIFEKSGALQGCLFIVDSDYDDYVGITKVRCDHVYYTDFYSLESVLLEDLTFETILEEIVCLDRNSISFKETLHELIAFRDQVYHCFRPYYAWLIHQRLIGARLNLNNGDTSIMLDVVDDKVLRQKEFNRHRKSIMIESDTGIFGSIIKIRRQLQIKDGRRWMRGKDAARILVRIFRLCIEKLSRQGVRRAGSNKKLKVPNSLSVDGIFTALSGRDIYPKSFVSFLLKHTP